MKTLMTGLLLVICVAAFSQATSYGNFRIDNQQLIYQKVFLNDSITIDKLGDYLVKLPFVSDFDRSGDEIKFKVNDLTVDFKKFGFNEVTAAPIIQSGKYSGDASIDVKNGKYRVTFYNVQLTGNIVYKKIVNRENLTTYACRDSGTSISPDWTKPNTLGVLDKAITDKFQYLENGGIRKDSDW
jgi:hypothetical protein